MKFGVAGDAYVEIMMGKGAWYRMAMSSYAKRREDGRNDRDREEDTE